MTEIFIYAGLLLISYFTFKKVFRKKIQPYNNKFWLIIEVVWLLVSFIGVSIGLYELNRIKTQLDYKESEKDILIEYQDLRNTIYGQTMIMTIDSTTSLNMRESINWFHTVQNLLEDGYKSNKWRKFTYYTRAFVFNEQGYINATQDNALIFKWPENLNLKPTDIQFKDEIKATTDRLVHLEESIYKSEKLKPDDKPLFFTRHIFILLFTIALSMKFLKIYADYNKSRQKISSKQ